MKANYLGKSLAQIAKLDNAKIINANTEQVFATLISNNIQKPERGKYLKVCNKLLRI